MYSMMAIAQPMEPLLALSGALQLLDSVWPFAVMLLGFSLIVFVHELGHFAAAKWAGVRVEQFAIGFGRELFGVTKGETRYSFNILPLGGYVKMLGQEDFDDKAKELVFKDDPRSYVNKPVGHRMVIISAGVVMNTLFACLLFMVVFIIGMKAMGTRIAYVEPDSPAERAGLQPGDVIKKINGGKVLEFNEVRTAVMLAELHEPIRFEVQRDGELKTIRIKPNYMIPENSREAKRLIVGISPGITREIVQIGPEIDPTQPDQPHIGDLLAEIDGVEITDENVNQVINMLAYAKGDVFVERKDAQHPDAPPRRVRVHIPPILTLYPEDGKTDSISVLGLSPLARVSFVGATGRASLAGIEAGDSVLSWDDKTFPTRASIIRTIQDCPERDIHFKVRKLDGRIVQGFVRPKKNRRGLGTIQAVSEPLGSAGSAKGGPQARFREVRRLGRAARQGIESGDVILSCNQVTNPSAAKVNKLIRQNRGRLLFFTVRKSDGREKIVHVKPEAPGSIDAAFNLVADDILRVSRIVKTIYGQPSPAFRAAIPAGALIMAIDGQPISRWRELIDVFRKAAGTTVTLAYRDTKNQPHSTAFEVPRSIRTVLDVGPEARILSIDGRKTVMVDTRRGREEVSVGYRKGTRTVLSQLIGHKRVRVEYRPDPLSSIRTASVDVTADMVNPWLGHIAYSPNINVAPETTPLKGENALDAIWIGVHKTYTFIVQVYRIFDRMIFARSVGLENMSGPLGILDMGGKFARAGFVEFIFFMAIISANLAVINFLPLPILDGGNMVFLIIELIKGSPVSLRVQVATQMIGLFLIVGVFLFVTFNDVIRMWG